MRARTRRLGVVAAAALLLVAAAGLAYIGLKENANLFYTPADLASRGGPTPGLTGKVGGFVAVGSLVYTTGTELTFRIVDETHHIDVQFDGVAPTLFQEGAGVVADGTFDGNGVFVASRLLAKHDENYVPRELEGVQGPAS